MKFKNGDRYVGRWSRNQMDDSDGKYTYANGNVCKGGFRARN